VQLKDLSGIELWRHLDALGFSLPVIFMTGSDDPKVRTQAIALDCVAFLQKPLSQRILFDAIAAATGTPSSADNSAS
jgi:FixJ family two-component response regulator